MKKVFTLCAAVGLFALAVPAWAQSVSAVPTSATLAVPRAGHVRGFKSASTTAERVAAVQNRADAEIKSRETTLNNLLARVQAMSKLSDAQKASLTATIQSNLAGLSQLEGAIAADTSTTTVRSDAASITKAYRIYALVVPKASIIAAADRISTLVASLTTIAGKLGSRIVAASGDTSALSSTLSDLNAKVADATAQAAAASNEVSGLAPDNGTGTILASNNAALKDARAKLGVASKDLAAAREDAETVVKGLKALRSATATSTATR